MEQRLGFFENVEVGVVGRNGGGDVGRFNPIASRDGYFQLEDNDRGTATFVVPISGLGVDTSSSLECEEARNIMPFGTEVEIAVDGVGMFAGPVTNVQHEWGKAKVAASDMTLLWDKRLLPDVDLEDRELTDLFSSVHESGTASDPIGLGLQVVSRSETRSDRNISVEDRRSLGSELASIADAGVDYVTRFRTCFLSGQPVEEPVASLSDQHFTEGLRTELRGEIQANRVIVIGIDESIAGIAEDRASIAAVGLLEHVEDIPEIETVREATDAAHALLAELLRPVFLRMPQQSTLAHDAPITLAELLPGRIVEIAFSASCYPLQQQFRISTVRFSFDRRVTVGFQPVAMEREFS